jgi:hypothetical protein
MEGHRRVRTVFGTTLSKPQGVTIILYPSLEEATNLSLIFKENHTNFVFNHQNCHG